MADFYLATEDALSEAICEKILAETGHRVASRIPKDRRRHHGFGYLKMRLPDFVRSSNGGVSFFVLADLDASPCPSALIDDWYRGLARPTNLILRIAVREAESWILADRHRLADWLKIEPARIPAAPEGETAPKERLLALAGSSGRREIREGLVARQGAAARQGLRYNDLLCEFVRKHWRLEHAAQGAPSLRRALDRLVEFR